MTPTRSLILTAHEVRAALRGDLRMVVLPVMPQPEHRWNHLHGLTFCSGDHDRAEDCNGDVVLKCPFGVTGTVLLCKEVWRVGAWRDYDDDQSKFAFDYKATPEITRTPWLFAPDEDSEMYLREQTYAELIKKKVQKTGCRYVWEPGKSPLHWRSPATMPAWASRITLEVATVGVCRLGDFTDDDALACGIADLLLGTYGMNPLTIVRDKWNDRYADKGMGWDSNPWVWKCGVKGVPK